MSQNFLASHYSIDDLRATARRRLPRPVFDFMEGGSETEVTLRRNLTAWDDHLLVPDCLSDVSGVDTTTELFGQKLAWPVICSPTGGSRLFHNDGEVAVARAACAMETLYCLSTASSITLERVAAAASGPKVFQLYVQDRDVMRETIERAQAANYCGLCVTIDSPQLGKRERDLRSGFQASPKFTAKFIAGFALHPFWVAQRIGKNAITIAHPMQRTLQPQPYQTLSWDDLDEIRRLWRGPLAVKGVMSVDDARRAVDAGVSVIFLSNHGGRQLDGAAAPLDVLPRIAEALGDRVDLVLDGGVRRGVHVMKALALGAKACSIGRPYLYGLAAGGEAGVSRALQILKTELVLAMQLAGRREIAAIDRSLLF